MGITLRSVGTKLSGRSSLLFFILCAAPCLLSAQNIPSTATPQSAVPEWAQPGSPTHKQVPPPADFHRPSRNLDTSTAKVAAKHYAIGISATVTLGGKKIKVSPSSDNYIMMI